MTLSPFRLHDKDSQINKSQKSRSFMSSLKHLSFPRRKHHHKKDKQNENNITSQLNGATPTNFVPHSLPSGKSHLEFYDTKLFFRIY
jgi:hypothetical protein